MPFTDLQPFIDAIDLSDKLFQQKVKILQLAKQINNENLVDPKAPYTTNNLRDILELMLQITQGIEAEARVIMPPKPKPSFIQRIRRGGAPTRARGMSASFNYGLASLAITKADRILKNNKAMHADYVDAVEQCARSLKKLMEQIGATTAPPQRRRAASVARPPKPQPIVTDLQSQVLSLLTDNNVPPNPDDDLGMFTAAMHFPDAPKPPIKFTIIPPPPTIDPEDIDPETRKRRQEKVFNKKAHIQRAKTGVGKELIIIDDWKTLATILIDDIGDAHTNRATSKNLSGDYNPAAVNQNLLDKQAVFAKLASSWDEDDHTIPFAVKFYPDNEPEVQLLGILPTVDATTNVIQQITLTQHSYLNVGHAATTEMLAKAADCMHAQHVEISCVDAAGKVYLPGIVEGVKNALYANLIPVLDQPTQLALAAYVKSSPNPYPPAVAVQNICELCRRPNNAAQVFAAFETAVAGYDPNTGHPVGFVDEPYSSVRNKRKI